MNETTPKPTRPPELADAVIFHHSSYGDMAALVTRVYPDGETVSLAVFFPNISPPVEGCGRATFGTGDRQWSEKPVRGLALSVGLAEGGRPFTDDPDVVAVRVDPEERIAVGDVVVQAEPRSGDVANITEPTSAGATSDEPIPAASEDESPSPYDPADLGDSNGGNA